MNLQLEQFKEKVISYFNEEAKTFINNDKNVSIDNDTLNNADKFENCINLIKETLLNNYICFKTANYDSNHKFSVDIVMYVSDIQYITVFGDCKLIGNGYLMNNEEFKSIKTAHMKLKDIKSLEIISLEEALNKLTNKLQEIKQNILSISSDEYSK